jgi:hypothetical protein
MKPLKVLENREKSLAWKKACFSQQLSWVCCFWAAAQRAQTACSAAQRKGQRILRAFSQASGMG